LNAKTGKTVFRISWVEYFERISLTIRKSK
jgi:hypothetical protein